MERTTTRRARLENGLTIISERIPSVRSVSLGVWVRIGSRFEPPEQAGVSHFIEHMLFKGTETRSARDIAFAIDALGGQLDAFTTKEHACYYANVLDAHLAEAFDLIADIVLHPAFDEAELELERAVILEELASVEDSPEELLWEEFVAAFWRDHALGIPILGTSATVEALERAHLKRFFERVYEPQNVVVAASGHLEHDDVRDLVAARFGELRNQSSPAAGSAPRPCQHFRLVRKRQLEQVHIAVGAPAPAAADEARYAAFLLNAVLGGSISSRLFQRIREEHGLAYKVYSALETYADAGCFWIYAATRAGAAAAVIDLIIDELATLCDVAVSADELGHMKEHLKGNVVLGLEGTTGRMSTLAQQEIYFGRAFNMDDIIAGIDAVRPSDVQLLAQEVFAADNISVDLLAQQQAATALQKHFAGGLRLPGGGKIALS